MKHVHIHTDGSSRGNPGPGGHGTVVTFGEWRKELSAGFRRTTNNRMEVLAAIVGLESLHEPCKVTITSDSRYLVDTMTKGWIEGWKKRSWKKRDKSDVKNVDLWVRLERAADGHDIEWKWVKGHAGHRENERCDILATEAADGSCLEDDEGFAG